MLGTRQRRSLFQLMDVITKLLSESHLPADLMEVETELNHALALIERDFPMSLQVHAHILRSYSTCIQRAEHMYYYYKLTALLVVLASSECSFPVACRLYFQFSLALRCIVYTYVSS